MPKNLSDVLRGPNNDTVLILFSTVSFTGGTLTYPGDVWIEGVFDGTLVCRSIIVKASGQAYGTLIAEQVTVSGTADAAIYADRLTLKSGCNVSGEIYHRHLELEDAAFFEGKSRRHENPREDALAKLDLD